MCLGFLFVGGMSGTCAGIALRLVNVTTLPCPNRMAPVTPVVIAPRCATPVLHWEAKALEGRRI